jgi:hypothetical protein
MRRVRAPISSSYFTDPITQSTSRPLSVDARASSDMTESIDEARASNHEQSSVEISPNLPDADMATNEDACDGTIETIRTTELVMSDAILAETGSTPVPHFFKDAANGVLPSPSVISGD